MRHEMRQYLGIVFIHGAGLGSWIWGDVLPLMDVPALAVDFPKRDTSSEARKSLTLDDYYAEVVKKIEDLKVQKVVIVAHSLGGVVALKVAEALGWVYRCERRHSSKRRVFSFIIAYIQVCINGNNASAAGYQTPAIGYRARFMQ